MPGLNKVYLPRPRPVVLHVCASHPGQLQVPRVWAGAGKAGSFPGLCYPLSQESLPSLKTADPSLEWPGRQKWESQAGADAGFMTVPGC